MTGNEKRLIDAYDFYKKFANDTPTTTVGAQRYVATWRISDLIADAPTVDAVEVDTVIEMFEYMMGDCPCNFSPVDEWLAEQCELQEECPNPADKRGCWKQFIKHFCAKMDGDGNDI